jgi:hypothetical protein
MHNVRISKVKQCVTPSEVPSVQLALRVALGTAVSAVQLLLETFQTEQEPKRVAPLVQLLQHQQMRQQDTETTPQHEAGPHIHPGVAEVHHILATSHLHQGAPQMSSSNPPAILDVMLSETLLPTNTAYV